MCCLPGIRRKNAWIYGRNQYIANAPNAPLESMVWNRARVGGRSLLAHGVLNRGRVFRSSVSGDVHFRHAFTGDRGRVVYKAEGANIPPIISYRRHYR